MESSSKQFGLMVAYLLPGFIVLAGIAPFAPLVAAWLQPLNQAQASLGAPVYAVLAATTIGMVVSCFRWLIIDHIHHWTGVRPPAWDDSRLSERVGAFNYLVDNHYRYYQFYANILIALTIAYPINRAMTTSRFFGVGTDLGFLMVCVALFAGSRDALSKYYARTIRLIGQFSEKGGTPMTNGNHHDAVGTGSARPRPETHPKPTPEPRPDQAKAAKPVKETPNSERR